MSYYELSPEGANVMAFVPNVEFRRELEKCGFWSDLGGAHRLFLETRIDDQVVQLIRVDKDRIVTDKKFFADVIFMSWVSIFSHRARELVLNLGGSEGGFFPCNFESKECGGMFYWYIPTPCDVVDMEKSKFLIHLPDAKLGVIPHNIISMETIPGIAIDKHCFRAKKAQPGIVFSELIVSDKFKELWEGSKFTGAKFRKLTAGI